MVREGGLAENCGFNFSFFLLKFLQNAGNCRFRGLTYAPDFKPGKVNLTMEHVAGIEMIANFFCLGG